MVVVAGMGEGGSDSEGEQCRISKMILDPPVGKPKCIIPLDEKYTTNGVSGALRRSIWFLRTFLRIYFGGTNIPFVVLPLGIPEEGASGYFFFLNHCLTLEWGVKHAWLTFERKEQINRCTE